MSLKSFFSKHLSELLTGPTMFRFSGSDLVPPKMSWEALERPNDFNLILAANLRDDAEKTREFLQLAEEIGDRSSQALKGDMAKVDVCNFFFPSFIAWVERLP